MLRPVSPSESLNMGLILGTPAQPLMWRNNMYIKYMGRKEANLQWLFWNCVISGFKKKYFPVFHMFSMLLLLFLEKFSFKIIFCYIKCCH